jgi:hypothetical protein
MASPSPQGSPASQPIPSPPDPKSPTRRTSFGFLHRSKSKEPLQNRKGSGGKITKKHEQAREEELRRLQGGNLMAESVPKLPDFKPSPQLQTFGGEEPMSDSAAQKSRNVKMEALARTVPMPPMPGQSQTPDHVDPYARSESMTHRGRYSYAPSAVSSIDSPRRVRRRKDPTPYK